MKKIVAAYGGPSLLSPHHRSDQFGESMTGVLHPGVSWHSVSATIIDPRLGGV